MVMRVISGRFKGVQLTTPRSNTRPTTDRTKEAIFSRLDSVGAMYDARVLDLYAGTGAFGVEALSRGARELVAVEKDPASAALIAQTLTRVKHSPNWESDMSARVIRASAERYVHAAAKHVAEHSKPDTYGPFDLVLIDPPYAVTSQECNALLGALVEGGVVNEDGMIMLERSTRSDAPTAPRGWEETDQRDYGETAVFYYAAAEADDESADE